MICRCLTVPVEKIKVVDVADQCAGAVYVEENDQHHWVRTDFLKPEFQGMGIGSSNLRKEASRAKDAGKPLIPRYALRRPLT
jgi:hypothetical protein